MHFRNRIHAAEMLARRLADLRGEHPLVLAVPRGAVPMGQVLASALDGELDVVLVRKLGAPDNPELAIGSVSETGEVVVSELARELGASQEYLDREVAAQLAVLRQRRSRYSHARPPRDPRGRTVIVVDDGVATGATLLAALQLLRQHQPRQLVAAVAVAPPSALRRIAAVADRVVCLHSTEQFLAVGQFFSDFSQVSDEEVIALLAQSAGGIQT